MQHERVPKDRTCERRPRCARSEMRIKSRNGRKQNPKCIYVRFETLHLGPALQDDETLQYVIVDGVNPNS